MIDEHEPAEEEFRQTFMKDAELLNDLAKVKDGFIDTTDDDFMEQLPEHEYGLPSPKDDAGSKSPFFSEETESETDYQKHRMQATRIVELAIMKADIQQIRIDISNCDDDILTKNSFLNGLKYHELKKRRIAVLDVDMLHQRKRILMQQLAQKKEKLKFFEQKPVSITGFTLALNNAASPTADKATIPPTTEDDDNVLNITDEELKLRINLIEAQLEKVQLAIKSIRVQQRNFENEWGSLSILQTTKRSALINEIMTCDKRINILKNYFYALKRNVANPLLPPAEIPAEWNDINADPIPPSENSASASPAPGSKYAAAMSLNAIQTQWKRVKQLEDDNKFIPSTALSKRIESDSAIVEAKLTFHVMRCKEFARQISKPAADEDLEDAEEASSSKKVKVSVEDIKNELTRIKELDMRITQVYESIPMYRLQSAKKVQEVVNEVRKQHQEMIKLYKNLKRLDDIKNRAASTAAASASASSSAETESVAPGVAPSVSNAASSSSSSKATSASPTAATSAPTAASTSTTTPLATIQERKAIILNGLNLNDTHTTQEIQAHQTLMDNVIKEQQRCVRALEYALEEIPIFWLQQRTVGMEKVTAAKIDFRELIEAGNRVNNHLKQLLQKDKGWSENVQSLLRKDIALLGVLVAIANTELLKANDDKGLHGNSRSFQESYSRLTCQSNELEKKLAYYVSTATSATMDTVKSIRHDINQYSQRLELRQGRRYKSTKESWTVACRDLHCHYWHRQSLLRSSCHLKIFGFYLDVNMNTGEMIILEDKQSLLDALAIIQKKAVEAAETIEAMIRLPSLTLPEYNTMLNRLRTLPPRIRQKEVLDIINSTSNTIAEAEIAVEESYSWSDMILQARRELPQATKEFNTCMDTLSEVKACIDHDCYFIEDFGKLVEIKESLSLQDRVIELQAQALRAAIRLDQILRLVTVSSQKAYVTEAQRVMALSIEQRQEELMQLQVDSALVNECSKDVTTIAKVAELAETDEKLLSYDCLFYWSTERVIQFHQMTESMTYSAFITRFITKASPASITAGSVNYSQWEKQDDERRIREYQAKCEEEELWAERKKMAVGALKVAGTVARVLSVVI